LFTLLNFFISNYLISGSAIPDPEALPVRVTVELMNKGVSFKEISMKPYD